MKRGYIIARDDKERDKNFNYISRKYSMGRPKNGSLIKFCKRLFSMTFHLFAPYWDFSNEVCKLYMEEINLFYINNNFRRVDLQIRKSYFMEKKNHNSNIFLPILLSLAASIIYILCTKMFLTPLSDVINHYGQSLKTFMSSFENMEFIKNNIRQIVIIAALYAFLWIYIMTSAIVLVWIIIKAIYALSTAIGGFDFNARVVKNYEMDLLEKIISNDNYFKIIEQLNAYEVRYFDVINSLIYNMVIREGAATIEDIETKLGEKLSNNQDIIRTKELCDFFDEELIVKSIICRALLKINQKSSNLVMRKGKVFLKQF